MQNQWRQLSPFTCYADIRLTNRIIKEYADGLPKRKLNRALTYMAHLDQDISLKELADLVGMSSHYFACLFKQSVGLSPHQYLIDCRIKRAKQLLRERELPIVEICQIVGYQSQSYFTKVFRKHNRHHA